MDLVQHGNAGLDEFEISMLDKMDAGLDGFGPKSQEMVRRRRNLQALQGFF